MTKAEAREKFQSKVYAALGLDAAGWNDGEILNFIELATMNIVQELSLAEAFDLISNIVKTSTEITLTDNTVTIPNEYSALLSGGGITNYLYYVRSRCRVEKTTTYVMGEFIQAHEAEFFYETPTHKPFFRKPKVYIQGGAAATEVRVITDDTTRTPLDRIWITYVQKPTFAALDGVDSNAEDDVITNVNISLHEKILETAVVMATESILKTERSSQ